MKSADRLRSVDALRGYAALGVAVGHVYYLLIGGPNLFPNFGVIASQFGYAVELFFLISGFTMLLTYDANPANRSPAVFWIKRFFRIAPLFYVCIGINTVLMHVAGWYSPANYQLGTVLSNLTLTFNLSPADATSLTAAGWTIGVEIMFYSLFPALVLLRGRAFGVAFAVAIMLAYLSKYVVGTQVSDPVIATYLGNYCVLNFIPVFMAGMLIYKAWSTPGVRRVLQRPLVHRGCLVAFGGWALLLAGGAVPLHYAHHVWAVAFVFLMVWALNSSAWVMANPVTDYLGRVSYSVYLLHGITIGYFVMFMRDGWLEPIGGWLHALVIGAICLVTVLIASAITFRFVESPGNAVGRKLAKTARPRAGLAPAE